MTDIPKGLLLMFKAMGFDPQKLQADFQLASDTARNFVDNLNARLDAIEASQKRIENELAVKSGKSYPQQVIEHETTERNGAND